MEPVQLSKSGACDFEQTQCVICQKSSTQKLSSTSNGCKSIREASVIRNDSVATRLQQMPVEKNFFYHISNDCYKKYTNATLLRRIQEGTKSQKTPPNLNECGNPPRLVTRSDSSIRSAANPSNVRNISFSMKCIVCDKKSYNREYKKYRISESDRASKFLEASNFFQDDVFIRVCDLQDERSVFGADFVLSQTMHDIIPPKASNCV